MATRFDGKVALITGGNSGLGLAAAKAFAAEGADVVISGRDRQKLDAAVVEIGAKAIGIVADVSRVPDIVALMREVESRKGRIDVLFANAGIARFAPIGSVTEFGAELVDRGIRVNVVSPGPIETPIFDVRRGRG